ncbi:TonB-dependent receptor [Roseococcus pinisoli]|uniref:TonB-dependent receptor n=1 Tax=Roseococcus pinisoli TaxID=2835040 RepID=A0ABS5QBV7_9PROT|nr:TonB-dependent receptor [Roseococcus pinisoli]MBS7810440.1 TonB-dependent receptor [Roseococcus pinisoli]
MGLALRVALLGTTLLAGGGVVLAQAQTVAPAIAIAVPPGPLAQALNRLAGQTGLQIVYDAALAEGRTSPGASGSLTPSQALERVLIGTGLMHSLAGGNVVRLQPIPGPESAVSLPQMEVTGQAAPSTAMIGNLPRPYAGGQVATGGQLGLLGNRSIMDTPFSATNYTAETIRNTQARSLADLMINEPSVRMVSPVSNGSEVFNMRGFSVANQDVAFGGLFGILPFWRGSVASAERVEVLRGPNALLNGMSPSGASGGAINLVPKRADDIALTRVTANYISGSNFGGAFDVGRRFGTDNRFGARINGVYRDGDYSRTSQQHGEVTGGFDWRGDRARLSLDIGWQQERQQGTEGLMGLAANLPRPPTAPNATRSMYQPWTFWNSDAVYGVLRGEYDIAQDVTAYGAFGGRHYTSQYILPFGQNLQGNGAFTENAIYNNEYYDAISSEVGIRGRVQTGPVVHRLSLAGTYVEQTSGVVGASLSPLSSNIYSPRLTSRPNLPILPGIPRTGYLAMTSIAVADTMSFLDERVNVTAGLRQQYVRSRSYSAVSGVRTAAYSQDALTPVVGLVVKPWRNVSVYANYIEGLSQGGMAPAGTRNAGEILAPFVANQYEVGVKVDWGNVTTTLAAFQITRPSSFTDPATNFFVSNGEQRNRGLEFNAFGEAWPGVRLLGGAMYMEAELTSTAGGALNGRSAVNAPRWSLNLGGEWDTPFVPGLTLSGRVIHTASAYLNQQNTQRIPDWTRFDIGARYRFQTTRGPITLHANIENLFDKNYWMSSSLYRGAPRTFLFAVSADF